MAWRRRASGRACPTLLVQELIRARRDPRQPTRAPAPHRRRGRGRAGPWLARRRRGPGATRAPLADERTPSGRSWLARLPYFIVIVSALEFLSLFHVSHPNV
ncbi:Protein of unknown function [Gryllus bimaculatus]|nr:Protein of unknown function [Gryllus bimaculatus]